jgi:hypothetical protein
MHEQDADNPHRREYRVLLLPTDDTIDEFARQIDMAVGHTTFTVTHKSRTTSIECWTSTSGTLGSFGYRRIGTFATVYL